MFDLKVHTRPAEALVRRSNLLKVDDGPMARIAASIAPLLTPPILVPLAAVAALAAYGLSVGHL